jgi:hypothetical protein
VPFRQSNGAKYNAQTVPLLLHLLKKEEMSWTKWIYFLEMKCMKCIINVTSVKTTGVIFKGI